MASAVPPAETPDAPEARPPSDAALGLERPLESAEVKVELEGHELPLSEPPPPAEEDAPSSAGSASEPASTPRPRSIRTGSATPSSARLTPSASDARTSEPSISTRPPPATPRPRSVAPTSSPRPLDRARDPRREPPISGRPLRDSDGAPSAPRGAPSSKTGGSLYDGDGPPLRVPRPFGTAPGSSLSPRMTAVFGALFGLATVASIIALLIQVKPPKDERALLGSASPSANASATAVPKPVSTESRRPKRTPIPGPWRIGDLSKDPSVVIESGEMEKKAFLDALGDKGVPKAQAYRIMKALDSLKKFDKTAKHDRFSVAMERSGKKVKAFEYEVSPTEIYQAREGSDGLLAGVKLDMKIADGEVQGAFYVGSDLAASVKDSPFEDGLLGTIDEALGGRMSSDAFEEGGTVRAIAIEETALGLFARYKKIVALEYRPPDPAAKALRIYSFQGQTAHGYFDDRGKQPNAGGWQAPVTGAPVTSHFNPKRMHPVLHKIMPHEGTDFGAATGTPIYAAYKGVIQTIGPLGPCGNATVIDHGNGLTTGYCHQSRFATGLKAGDHVGTHQLIGYVGQTGRATGPHLHFFAKRDGKFFDAETLLVQTERVLPVSERPAFADAKAVLDKRLDSIPLPEPPEKPAPAAPPSSASAAPPKSDGPQATTSAEPASGSPSSTPGGPAPAPAMTSVESGDDDDDGKGEAIAGPSLSGVPMGPAPATAKPKVPKAPH